MNVQRLVSVAAALAACYTMGACGSDTNDAGTGGATGGAGKGGGASTGGGSAAAGSGSGGMPVTAEQCVASHFSGPGITSACKSCMCECNAALASVCDENCWSLPRCVQVTCAGNASDLTCITSMCGAFLAGAAKASPLASCFTKCGPAECAGWFIAGSGGAGSGGGGGATSTGGGGGATSTGGGGGATSTGGAAGMSSEGGAAGSSGASSQAGAGGEGG